LSIFYYQNQAVGNSGTNSPFNRILIQFILLPC